MSCSNGDSSSHAVIDQSLHALFDVFLLAGVRHSNDVDLCRAREFVLDQPLALVPVIDLLSEGIQDGRMLSAVGLHVFQGLARSDLEAEISKFLLTTLIMGSCLAKVGFSVMPSIWAVSVIRSVRLYRSSIFGADGALP